MTSMRWLLLLLIVHFAFIAKPGLVLAQADVSHVATGKLPIESQLKVRQLRLEAHFAAYAAWVNRVCDLSDEQKQQLGKVITDAITKSQAEQVKLEPAIKPHSSLFDSSPIRFVDTQGATRQVYFQGLEQSVLEESQQEKWHAANVKRNQLLHDIFLERVFMRIDSNVPYSGKLKTQLAGLFPAKIPYLENALYSMNPHTHYVQEKSILSIIMHPPMSFTKEEWGNLQSFRISHRVNDTVNIGFGFEILSDRFALQASDGPAGWRKTIDQRAEKCQVKLQKILMLKADTRFAGLQLSPEDRRLLEVAAKGAAFKTVAQWKERVVSRFASYKVSVEQARQKFGQGRNFSFGVEGVIFTWIDKHPLWVNAMKKVSISPDGQRKGEPSESTINYAIALLDQELWLDAVQHEKVKDLYRDVFIAEERLYQGRQYELYLLATLVDTFKPAELKEILDEEQIQAFLELKKQFQMKDSPLRNFINFDR